MRWILLVPCTVLSSLCFGQLPEYVFGDSLLLWTSLTGTVMDESGNGNNGELENVVYTEDDGLNVAYFNGQQSQIRFGDVDGINGEMLSISLKCNATNVDLGSSAQGYIPIFSKWYSGPFGGQYNSILSVLSEGHFRTYIHPEELPGDCDNFNYSSSSVQGGEWMHLVYTFNEGEVSIFRNSQLFYSWTMDCVQNIADSDTDLLLGGWYSDINENYASYEGLMRDFGVWNRILSQEEIQSLYLELPIEFGCLESLACNYNEVATVDDGSCDFQTCLCLQGTTWNDSLGGCIPSPSICNEGTYWDDETQSCIPINLCQADLNNDGIIGAEDLLTLLSSFGTPCPPVVSEWTCGDPVSYHGYDYETVFIGEQCWFAENLRTELYQNGDSLLTGLSQQDWGTTDQGACSVAGEGNSFCNGECSDGFDACDEIYNLELHGRLYNGHVVMDSRQICPQDWHISHAEDWDELESFVIGEGYNATQTALPLKQSIGWCTNPCGGFDVGWAVDQVDEFGFSATAGGDRDSGTGPYGGFFFNGCYGTWWSPSLSGEFGAHRRVSTFSSHVESLSSPNVVNHGRSIRCIKD